MATIDASSPAYLRKMGINRLWPTSPVTLSCLHAAMPSGMLTDVSKDTGFISPSLQVSEHLHRFAANGPKFTLTISSAAAPVVAP